MNKQNSFILYTDYAEIFQKLSDEQTGKLIKAIYQYVITGKMEDLETPLDYVMIPIKQNLDRNAKAYQETVEKRKMAGSQGGKKRALNIQANQANAKFATNVQANKKVVQANLANQADNDNDNVNVNDTSSSSIDDLDIFLSSLEEEEEEILKNYSLKNGVKNFRPWLRTLMRNGDYRDIIKRERAILEEQKTVKKEPTQTEGMKEDFLKVKDSYTAACFLTKYVQDFSSVDYPPEIEKTMGKYNINRYVDAEDIIRAHRNTLSDFDCSGGN